MSLYQFISCNSKISELFSDKKRMPDGTLKTITFDDDVDDLEIVECSKNNIFKDVFYYTKYENIYTIDWEYSTSNCIKLMDYLKSIKTNSIIEIWSIRLCNFTDTPSNTILNSIITHNCSINTLTLDYLEDKVRCIDSGDTPKVLIIAPS